jgi:hypothetical protein
VAGVVMVMLEGRHERGTGMGKGLGTAAFWFILLLFCLNPRKVVGAIVDDREREKRKTKKFRLYPPGV